MLIRRSAPGVPAAKPYSPRGPSHPGMITFQGRHTLRKSGPRGSHLEKSTFQETQAQGDDILRNLYFKGALSIGLLVSFKTFRLDLRKRFILKGKLTL